MRRIPYAKRNGLQVSYFCPKCKLNINQDKYKLYDYCPNCHIGLNKTAKQIMQFYYIYDKDMYDYFIHKFRRR